jgi:CelD/BcsL family acetyltransferase involved in cellulose biosynthesis
VSSPQRTEKIDAEGLRDSSLLDAWRRLALLRGNPFLSPEWFFVAAQLIPEESPYAIGWWVGGVLCGVLPLVARQRGPLGVLRFPNARRGDWFGPACKPEDERAMGEACARFLEGERWNALVLDRVDDSSAWPEALVGGKLTLAPRRRSDLLPFIAFDERGYEGYLADRSRNFRSQLGRRRRKLERDHRLSFRMTSSSPGGLEADLATFFRLHDERWQDRGGSTFGSEHSRRLLTGFAREAQKLGWLRLWVAEADGEPAAAWYGWRVGERYCYSLAGLAQRFQKHGLGTVLLAHTIEQAAAEGAAVYDLMWGDESYKERFATGQRTAGTWYLTSGQPSRLALGAAVRGVHALESLPPGAREPLRRVKRGMRRS